MSGFWLGETYISFKTVGSATFLLDTYEDVNQLFYQANTVKVSELVSLVPTNIGDYLLKLYAVPFNRDAMPKLTPLRNMLRVRGLSEWNNINHYDLAIREYYYLGQYYYSVDDYKDYSAFTSVQVYLPYYGFVDVSPNDIANKYLQFRMSMDFTSGSCVYYIGVSSVPLETVDNDADNIERIIGSYPCDIAINIPFTASNATEAARNAILKLATTAVNVTGGMVAGLVADTTPIQHSNVKIATVGYTKERFLNQTYRYPVQEAQVDKGRKETDQSEYFVSLASKTISDSMTALSRFAYSTQSYNVNATNNQLNSPNHIKVIIKKAKVIPQPTQFNHLFGRPLGETRLLSTLRGYTQISNIHFENPLLATATEEEKAMLKEACLRGIYL